MTRDDIEKVMRRFPNLNASGLANFYGRNRTDDQAKRLFERERHELLESADICTRCCEWINKNLLKTKKPTTGSYYLKHVAEMDLGYIANGIFIAAAAHCGFSIKPIDMNADIGVSKHSLNAVCKRQASRSTVTTHTSDSHE